MKNRSRPSAARGSVTSGSVLPARISPDTSALCVSALSSISSAEGDGSLSVVVTPSPQLVIKLEKRVNANTVGIL